MVPRVCSSRTPWSAACAALWLRALRVRPCATIALLGDGGGGRGDLPVAAALLACATLGNAAGAHG